MLKTIKSTTITGSSIAEDGKTVVATMHCTINDDGAIAKNSTIINREIYNTAKDSVRADIEEFETLCHLIEDSEVGA